MSEIKKILIADDHAIVLTGLHSLISLNFNNCDISLAASNKELDEKLDSGGFTHLILDLSLDDGSSLETIPRIIEKHPNLRILIYSMAPEEIFGRKLMKYNISGYLNKASDVEETVSALRSFLDGEVYISNTLERFIDLTRADRGNQNIFDRLSETEFKVLQLFLKGTKAKIIAEDLGVTQQTIATFKSRIFKKLGTENFFDIKRMAELYNIAF